MLLEDKETTALTNSVMDWINIDYKADKDTYVVIYLTPSLMKNGQLIILRGDKTYTVTGQEYK